MDNNYKQFKLWKGLVVLAVTAVIVFVVSPRILAPLGLYGSLLAEWLMLLAAVVLVLGFRGDLRELFPVKRPTASGVFGTILIWVGAFLIEMVLILILSIFFPERIMNVNVGLSAEMISAPFLLAFLAVAVTPAICEEAVFRGIFLRSLNPGKYKWAAILISGLVFGMFHADVFRLVPTAIGGIMMAYILLESGNMIYNSLFHFINNLLPLVLLFGLSGVYEKLDSLKVPGMQAQMMDGSTFMASAGIYMMMSAAAPSCIYIGNYLLHSRTPGYRDKLLPSKKPGTVILLIVSSAVLFMGGLVLTAVSIINMPRIII